MAVTESRFSFAVGPANGNPVQEVASFDSVSLGMSFDTGSDLSFAIPGNSPTARLISELASDVWMFTNGAITGRFRIVAIGQSWGPNNEDEVAVSAVCYKRLMSSRLLTPAANLEYTNTPQADLIADIIDRLQSLEGGDMGIDTAGGVLDSDGRNRDRTFVAGENVGTILENLSGVIDGPWWGIDGHLNLNVLPGRPEAWPERSMPVMLGATARSLSRGAGTGEFANAVFVDGDSDSTTPVMATAAGLSSDPRGRWERAVGFPNVTLQTTLTEKANGLIADFGSPLAQWSCEIEPGRFLTDADYRVGDRVTIVVPETVAAPIGNPGFSTTGQVMSTSLSYSADGALDVSMEVIEA